ncbi:hypothetical protein E2C01_064150 [Portunus trituberculatus]|uniref:Uncharacterized protein n=1 Tax=Portunus trituberculatus TaxID=210409 RepID=A0A5B7HKY5_PORTR|nr:hypothetical protein [Portunus trituberculatus]
MVCRATSLARYQHYISRAMIVTRCRPSRLQSVSFLCGFLNTAIEKNTHLLLSLNSQPPILLPVLSLESPFLPGRELHVVAAAAAGYGEIFYEFGGVGKEY